MIRQVFFGIAILFTCIDLNAQNELKKRNNLVFLEVMGAADEGLGVGYERYFFWNDLSRAVLRAGISHDFLHNDVPLFFGSSLIFGKRHNLEMGVNFMRQDPEDFTIENPNYDYNNENSSTNSAFNDVTKRRDIFNFLVGYRYQNERSGIMVRSFLGTKIKREMRWGDPGIHAGASLGIAF